MSNMHIMDSVGADDGLMDIDTAGNNGPAMEEENVTRVTMKIGGAGDTASALGEDSRDINMGEDIESHAHIVRRTSTTFLSLPAELQWDIYGQLLIAPVPICISGTSKTGYSSSWDHTDVPRSTVMALLLTNKQVSRYAAHFIYSRNEFVLNIPVQRDWLRNIGFHNARAIRTLHLEMEDDKKTGATRESLLHLANTLAKTSLFIEYLLITLPFPWNEPHHSISPAVLVNDSMQLAWDKLKHLKEVTVSKPAGHSHDLRDLEKPLYKRLSAYTDATVVARSPWNRTPAGRIWFTATPPQPYGEKTPKKFKKCKNEKKRIEKRAKAKAKAKINKAAAVMMRKSVIREASANATWRHYHWVFEH